MIRYALNCQTGHEFEVWFRSSSDFDDQQSRKIIACPLCGSHKVEKAIMAPNVSIGKKAGGEHKTAPAAQSAPEHDLPAAPQTPSTTSEPAGDMHGLNLPDPKEMVEAIRKYRTYVTENADNVGDKFADVARKIHYDEEPERGIYGNATPDEVNELLEEGVEIAPIPTLPEDNN